MNKPRLILDMYVLGQGIKTGVYRVCDEIFPRLARSSRFETSYLLREGFESSCSSYIDTKQLIGKLISAKQRPPESADILLSPFGVAPEIWRDDERVLQVHIIYDLIAIRYPEYFTPEAAAEVRDIVASLNARSVIFAISESTKRDLLSYRPDLRPEQITVMYLAAASTFRPCHSAEKIRLMRNAYGIPDDVPYLLALATLEVRKNLDQVVNAFVLYLNRNPDSAAHLVLAGMTGWKLEQLHQALRAAGPWRERIVLAGFVEDSDLGALYSDAKCFIYLSRYEGFGLPPLEAMSCGTPVISANNSSLPEVIGDAGLLFDADDVDGVATAIDRILNSPEFRARLSEKGIERAKTFDWDSSTELMIEALENACKQHNEHLKLLGSSHRRASLLGYRDGDVGPTFDSTSCRIDADRIWPIWRDTLPTSVSSERFEGGLRTQGHYKINAPEMPLVTYVTVVRNNRSTLERAILSVQQQTYRNVEHIILDGASTDGTLDIIRRYSSKLDYCASEPDNGLYDALNKAIPLSRGQLICVLNSDDWLEPSAAEIAVRHIANEAGGCLLLSAASVRIDGSVHHWEPAFVHPGSYFICANDCHNAIYANRVAYERSGPYDTTYKIAADFKWIMRCLDVSVSFFYTKEATVNYSLGGVSGDSLKHGIECMNVVHQRFDFLKISEVRGLYHCFFCFSSVDDPYHIDRPANPTEFLRNLWSNYSDRPDFLMALGWALITRLEFPIGSNAHPPESALVRRIVQILTRFPRLYKVARGVYRRLSSR